jgi:uncharacterized protein with NRDE domain
MCLIALAWGVRPELPLVVLANRDERYARETEPMHAWEDGTVAGRDRERGGTWLGVRPHASRFAAITNVRDPADLRPPSPGEPSRGDLVRTFLEGDDDGEKFAERAIADRAMRGFNLLLLDDSKLVWCSNRAHGEPVRRIGRGVHGISNAALDTPWPKVERAKAMLSTALRDPIDLDVLFAILADDARPPDDALPDTGVGLALERELAPIRITMPLYGTRCSTVLVARADGTATLIERTIAPAPKDERRFELALAIAAPA